MMPPQTSLRSTERGLQSDVMALTNKIMAALIIGTLASGMPTEDDAPADEPTIDGDAGETSRSIIPDGFPCLPSLADLSFLCVSGWCEPLICINLPIFGWITSYDFAGFCQARPASGSACVDMVPNLG